MMDGQYGDESLIDLFADENDLIPSSHRAVIGDHAPSDPDWDFFTINNEAALLQPMVATSTSHFCHQPTTTNSLPPSRVASSSMTGSIPSGSLPPGGMAASSRPSADMTLDEMTATASTFAKQMPLEVSVIEEARIYYREIKDLVDKHDKVTRSIFDGMNERSAIVQQTWALVNKKLVKKADE